LFRVTFKLTLIAAVGYGIAMAVKKLTAPADTGVPIEPWPPLPADAATAAATDSSSTNGDAAADPSSAATS
jgi:hypothetical protein